MARKPKVAKEVVFEDNIHTIDVKSSEYLNTTSLEYAMTTLDRGIPGIDGLKNSQRKAIFTLSKISGEIKTVSCGGRMISDGIYLHGDASACGTLQQLASPVANNYPLIGKRGGFGTQADSSPASARYTYVKKTKSTEDLVLCDKDVVPMQLNYDGTVYEPKHFLPIIPLVLFGANGISVGYKTTILPHKLEDIVHNCIKALEGKKQKPMVPYYKSNGCNDFVRVDGENKFTIFGKGEVIDASTVRITGLPVNTSLEKFTEKLISMEEDGKIRDYDDDSSKTIDITIKLPRGVANGWDENDIIKYFDLHSRITQSIVVLAENGKVKVYETTDELISDFVQFRTRYYRKRYEKMLLDSQNELKVKTLIKNCFDDDITDKLRTMKNRQEVMSYIISVNNKICASDEAIQNITNFAIHRWTQENYDQLIIDMKNINDDISMFTEILNSPEALRDIYISELKDLLKGNYEPVEKH